MEGPEETTAVVNVHVFYQLKSLSDLTLAIPLGMIFVDPRFSKVYFQMGLTVFVYHVGKKWSASAVVRTSGPHWPPSLGFPCER